MTTDTLTAAREAFIAAGDKYRTMQAQADEAAAELQRLDGMTGAELLDDPGKAEEIALEHSKAEHLAKLRAQMAKAAQGRWQAAAVPVLQAEADALQPAIDAAQRDVDQWHAKEQRLLAQLAEHAGVQYQREVIETQFKDFGYKNGGSQPLMRTRRTTAPAPRLDALQETLDRATAQQAALLRTAEGGEPLDACKLEWLPEALLPGGVVCTDRTAAAIRQAEQAQAARDARARAWERAQHRVTELAEHFGIDVPQLSPNPATEPGRMAGGWIPAIKLEVASWGAGRPTDDDLAAACELASLAGQPLGERALAIARRRALIAADRGSDE